MIGRFGFLNNIRNNILSFVCSYYSSEIAPTGHTPAQEPQLIQVLGSISNLPSPSLIAPTGHCPAQEPQEIQASLITYAMMKSSL